MPKPKSRPAQPDAAKFAEIAAECARVCGLDVRLTPLAAVLMEVGQPVTDPEGSPDAPGKRREVACLGVRFDDAYVIVRLPTGGYRALKVDATGRVVLRLGVCGGFRAHVSRVFGALIWDRLKQGRTRFEPELKLLPVEASMSLSTEASDLVDLEPAPASRAAEASPSPKAEIKNPPVTSPPPESSPPPLSESAAAFDPEPPALSEPCSGLRAGGAGPPAVSPSPSREPKVASSAAGAPLARRLRGPRAK